MARRLPDAKKVAADATAAAALLRDREKAAAAGNYPADAVEKAIAALAGRKALAEGGWDGAAQVYLGLAALNAARAKPAARKAELEAIRRVLRDSYNKGARPLYAVPTRYDATKLLPLLKP